LRKTTDGWSFLKIPNSKGLYPDMVRIFIMNVLLK
jgi:hypothetical protein